MGSSWFVSLMVLDHFWEIPVWRGSAAWKECTAPCQPEQTRVVAAASHVEMIVMSKASLILLTWFSFLAHDERLDLYWYVRSSNFFLCHLGKRGTPKVTCPARPRHLRPRRLSQPRFSLRFIGNRMQSLRGVKCAKLRQ